jgi:KipI family sensor histidine kinase inhibitor
VSTNGSASPARIREAGDSALLLEFDPVIEVRVNERVLHTADVVRAGQVRGVRDVVPTYRSVAVHFNPLLADNTAIISLLRRGSGEDPPAAERRTLEVPVVYGNEFGPDLEAVAGRAGLSIENVVERHSAALYRVFMLGFLPGFAYLGSVDPAIAAPRRPTPRLSVPAGSVGIAGRQTGIYPCQSPGGWQIIGRTPFRPFDPSRLQPALLAPGDHVRFMPVPPSNRMIVSLLTARPVPLPERRGSSVDVRGGPGLTVLRPGLFTTVQDVGRWGYQDSGVTVSGAMDWRAHRLSNVLVGNPDDAATLEVTLDGPELRIEQHTTIAITGADLSPTLDGTGIQAGLPITCPAGSVVRFGRRRAGARAYVAFAGGIAIPPVLGSRATHVLSGLGGLDGRPVVAGDRLPLGRPTGEPTRRRAPSAALPTGGARLRVLRGPQDEMFSEEAFSLLQRTRFIVSPQSDRMGYRLTGGEALPYPLTGEMISDSICAGAIQVPPSGLPILLMADRPTTGGYPQIATVITADLPTAAQLAPGDWIEFEVCTRATAVAALITEEGRLLAVR